jgi:hypothetical protein
MLLRGGKQEVSLANKRTTAAGDDVRRTVLDGLDNGVDEQLHGDRQLLQVALHVLLHDQAVLDLITIDV